MPYDDIEGNVTFTVHVAPNNGYTGDTKTFTVTMQKLDPNLTVTPSAVTVVSGSSGVASVEYNGNGTVSLSSGNADIQQALTYSNKTITLPYVLGAGEATVDVNLSASTGYTADHETLGVVMEKLDPNLTVNPSSVTVPYGGSATVQAAYNSSGNLRISGNSIRTEYDETTKVITIYHSSNIHSAQNITVSLDATSEYASSQAQFTVTMAAPETVLTVTPSASATTGNAVTATVSCNSGGTISATCNNSNIALEFDGTTITLPFYLFSTDTVVTVTVSVTANGDYPSAETTFTVTYVGGTDSGSVQSLAVYMPFNTSVTEDLCGNTWTTSGSPVIQDNALYLNGASFVGSASGITLSTYKFTIRFWLKLTGKYGTNKEFLTLATALLSSSVKSNVAIVLADYNTNSESNPTFALYTKEPSGNLPKVNSCGVSCSRNTWHYVELCFSNYYTGNAGSATARVTPYIDGTAQTSWYGGTNFTQVLGTSVTFNYMYLGRGDSATGTASTFSGYIDDLKIHSGWRSDYTPPARST